MSHQRSSLGPALVATAAVFAAMACGLPAAGPPTPDIAAIVTQTMQALQAAGGGAAPEGGQPAPPSATVAPLEPALPSETPTITSTPTPSVPMASVSVDTNCRVGPGKIYDYLGALLVGETTEVVARSSEGNYWVVKNPDQPGGTCWLWGQYASISGDTSGLPVMTPPPTPTPTVNFTVAVYSAENCAGSWGVYLQIQNTGVDAFESVSATVEDFDLGESHTDSKNFFPVAQGCVILAPPEKLDPGATGYHAVFDFSASPAAHNVRATVKLCTENGLGGNCVEKVVEDVVPAPSDVNLKTDVEAVDGREVLEALLDLPISVWRYKDLDPQAIHMGPMAQDFFRIFRLGVDDTRISAIDTGGVALAAIQGLNAEMEARDQRLNALEARLDRLEADRLAMKRAIVFAAVATFVLGGAAGWWLRGRHQPLY